MSKTKEKMAVSYHILFEVASNHTYYEDGIPPDLTFRPTQQTAELLKNNRLKLLANPGRFSVYFQSLDGTNPISDLGTFKLRFIIELQNAVEFLSFTTLDTSKTFTGKRKLLFQNDPPATSSIDHSLVDLIQGQVFTYLLPVSTSDPDNEKAELVMTHVASGESITISDIAANDTGSYEAPIDLIKAKSGLYSFQSTNTTSNQTETEDLYIDEELSKTQLLGLVEFTYDSNALSNYELSFQRKSSLWNYIVVNKSSRTDFADLTVKDNSTTNDPPYQNYQFQKQSGSVTIGAYDASVFQSSVAIPFYERPKLEIELVKEMNGSDVVVMKNLANPALNQISSNPSESDIYVFI